MIGTDELRRRSATDLQTVLSRKHEIQHDQIDGSPFQRLGHLDAISCGMDPKPVRPQELRNQDQDLTVIIDDQDFG